MQGFCARVERVIGLISPLYAPEGGCENEPPAFHRSRGIFAQPLLTWYTYSVCST
jgi:hypothetical protein